MKRCRPGRMRVLKLAGMMIALFLWHSSAYADPSRYPEFAQQKPAGNVTPQLISVEQLVQEVTAGKRPYIVDVRTAEEYREAHILGAVSAPLAEFDEHVQAIPRDRPVVLY
jgi:rhodanese-related sulfurtransferase